MQKRLCQNDWDDVLKQQFQQPYYQQLRTFLKQEYEYNTVYPPMDQIWTAFQLTACQDVQVVILGQDPYHGPNQAQGLSFSVNPSVPIPPSLRNMFKELSSDTGCEIPQTGDLKGWAQQGVFLLNTVLTVRHKEANSHRGQGWEQFTDAVIQTLSNVHDHLVFILWGRPAQQKKRMIDTTKHAIIEAPHPSPLSAHRGFFGSAPYSKANEYLQQWQKTPIDWCQTTEH